MLLIVPSDPLRPRRPDEHFTGEAQAARSAGWEVAVVDHDALVGGESPVGRISAGATNWPGSGQLNDVHRHAEQPVPT